MAMHKTVIYNPPVCIKSNIIQGDMEMSLRNFFKGATVGAVIGGGVSAGLTAASGATGAAILSSSGYTGYVASEAAKMGAIGGSIFGSITGALRGGLSNLGLFKKKEEEKDNNGIWESAISYTGGSVLGGLIGYGVLNSASVTVMELGQAAASFAVGGAVTMIPASCAIICICLPIAACALIYLKEDENHTLAPRV